MVCGLYVDAFGNLEICSISLMVDVMNQNDVNVVIAWHTPFLLIYFMGIRVAGTESGYMSV